MRTKKLGSLEVSVVGLGCNNFGMRIDEDATAALLDAALDQGVTCLDTADIYGGTKSEEWIGRHLEGKRDQVVIITKFGSPIGEGTGGASAAYVRTAAEASLRRLRTDHIDLYMLHRPDPDTPIADTLGALDELVQAGKVREIGCSNFSAAQLREAEAAATSGAARFVCVQNHYNLVHRGDDAEVIPTCAELGIAYMPFFPLASGVLTGKYRRGEPLPEGTRLAAAPERAERLLTDQILDAVERLSAWAGDHGHSLAELAIAALASQPVMTSVIAGATKPAQLAENVRAAEWVLTDAELAEVAALAG